MVSATAVIAWYTSGFVVAWWLVDRGHSPVVWWSLAALLGGMIVLPAAVARTSQRRSTPRLDVASRPEGPVDGLQLLVVGPTDRLSGALDAVPPVVAGRTGSVTVVGLVGHEAFCTGVDTGERVVAAAEVRAAVRPYSTADTRIVTTEGADRLDAVIEQAGTPDLVVADVPQHVRALRRSLRRHLEVSALHDVPVLFAPRGRALDGQSAVQPHLDVVT